MSIEFVENVDENTSDNESQTPTFQLEAVVTVFHQLSFLFCERNPNGSIDKIFIRSGSVANILKGIVSFKTAEQRRKEWEISWEGNQDDQNLDFHIEHFKKGVVYETFLTTCLLHESSISNVSKDDLVKLLNNLQMILPLNESATENENQLEPQPKKRKVVPVPKYLIPSKFSDEKFDTSNFTLVRRFKFYFLPHGFFFQLQRRIMNDKLFNPRTSYLNAQNISWNSESKGLRSHVFVKNRNCYPGYIYIGISTESKSIATPIDWKGLEVVENLIFKLVEDKWPGLECPFVQLEYNKEWIDLETFGEEVTKESGIGSQDPRWKLICKKGEFVFIFFTIAYLCCLMQIDLSKGEFQYWKREETRSGDNTQFKAELRNHLRRPIVLSLCELYEIPENQTDAMMRDPENYHIVATLTNRGKLGNIEMWWQELSESIEKRPELSSLADFLRARL